MPRLVLLVLVMLAVAGKADAHAPTTAIGRAVEAFGQVSVSYDTEALVSDVEAGGFPQIVGSNPKVAFMPASAASEIAGGPNAVAAEIAREADLDGTLVVLVGAALGAWSNDIGADRLREIVAAAKRDRSGASQAATVESLVRSVQTEPTGTDTPWGWIAVTLAVLALVGLVAFDWRTRRRSSAES